MRLEGLGLEFRVELTAEEERVPGNLHDFHVGAVRSGSRDVQAGAGQQRLVFAVEFVTMAVAL